MKNSTKPFNPLTLVLLVSVFIMFLFAHSAYSKKYEEEFENKIDLGNFGMHACILGKGKPSIIFESGHADYHDAWRFIQPELADNNLTLSYDRAGLGLSDNSPNVRTSLNKAKELYILLKQAKVKGPYIIVSHSMGSWVSRMFAQQYGDELAGLILVDPTHEDANEYTINSLPPDFLDSYKKEICKEGSYEDMLESIDQIKKARASLKNIPLTVISADNHAMGAQFEEKWDEWQKDIVSLSSKSNHITVNSSHNIQLEKPDAIIAAINSMLESTKKK